MRERPFTDAEVHVAVSALAEPGRLDAAQKLVASAAPQLQRVLEAALDEGGWFGSAHRAQVRRASEEVDPAAREERVRVLVEEEARLGMLVGVAVGMELARELDAMTKED